ncbi:Protein phosphatase 2C family protein [Quillaja saponaria]|uniref:Protein phosphatase 2C family protein n=1 Tax=Quillaja saponaria TaxID=32244 RepID=A0AAD7Q9H0_QUISA|nr:Protein phosphatase 2C family protein [Quillaja saponaria]
MLQGRRKSQEDRTLCALDIRIPFLGMEGIKEVIVGLVAVFDGHNGAEASEMASKLLLEYFVLHTYFLLDATYSIVLKKSTTGRLPNKRYRDNIVQQLSWEEILSGHELDFGRFKNKLPANFDDSFHLEILKEALLRAIHDIDAKFSEEASRTNIRSGSTATIILVADGKILVANVGDSKAFLCSEKFQSPAEAKASFLRLYRQKERDGSISRVSNYHKFRLSSSQGVTHFSVKELTSDHHPNRDDERIRVETAGGYVLDWGGVPRVNGQLAITRAIGDISFKSYGVISAPEVTDWQPLTANDSYLVAASDGVFEKLSLQEIVLLTLPLKKVVWIMWQLVVLPLGSASLQNLLNERSTGEGDLGFPVCGLQEFVYKSSDNAMASDLLQLEHAHSVNAKFERILVEVKKGNVGCFYLSENLDEHLDYTWRAKKNGWEDSIYDIPQALPQSIDQQYGGPVNLYNNENFCFHLGITTTGAKDQCVNPEGFASFLGLLESIPLHDLSSNNGSYDHTMPDMRYVLKKRFGRGSYGEVWLAFHWNCHQGSTASNRNGKSNNISSTDSDSHIRNSSSTGHDHQDGPSNHNSFILKRIMVERGAAVYLSGLREKYFGEVFLNASTCLEGLISSETPGTYDLVETNESIIHDTEAIWVRENLLPNKMKLQRDVYEEGLDHIARYVESFESRSNEIWLVFHHEGISLSKLMYTVEEAKGTGKEEGIEDVKRVQILRPSKWWHWLKTTEAGQEEMRSIIWQLLMALKSCHDRNITHRDIKPENMVICFEDQDTGKCLKESPSKNESFTTKMRIIDFGSGIDEFTLKHLYGSSGPSRAEQTDEYTPPEALLNATWYQGPTCSTLKYDMWSVGVVILELILGTPNVFQISALTSALLDRHLEGWNEGLKELAYKLRSFMELCILIPGSSSKHHSSVNHVGFSPASWKCSEEFFSHQIRIRDPLKLGFSNVWVLRLVRHLLLWDPEDRLTVDEALQHPYFKYPPR